MYLAFLVGKELWITLQGSLRMVQRLYLSSEDLPDALTLSEIPMFLLELGDTIGDNVLYPL